MPAEPTRVTGMDVTVGDSGQRMLTLMRETFDLPRSLTGDGVRGTLAAVARSVPVEVTEVPPGTRVFDWTVPPEWRVREAHVTAPDGTRVVDVAASPLHLLGYSVPVRQTLSREALLPHLHGLADRPAATPYRTSYWEPAWGFCLPQRDIDALDDGDYAVLIDTELDPEGSMTVGEIVVPGVTSEEVLISTPVCHPGLANDNLSGVAVLAELGRLLHAAGPLRRTHRILFSPGTIGPLWWLHDNLSRLDRIHAGLAVMCAGDRGPITYRRTRDGNQTVDRAMALVLAHHEAGADIRPFLPWGGDERQYNSPGFRLPIGALTRTPPGEYPENHTSDDDMSLISAESLTDTLRVMLDVIAVLEYDERPVSANPHGEPQLGRRGLTNRRGGEKGNQREMAMLWVLNLADGKHSLMDCAERSGLPFDVIRSAADDLRAAGLLRS
ncbi:MAG: DUF4910 domain-containing protein [Thermoleophilia bacterium]